MERRGGHVYPEEHVEMMATPARWPLGFCLPLKRHPRDGSFRFPDLAILVESSDGLKLIVGDLFTSNLSDDVLASQPVTTPQQVIADGWEVD